MVVFLGVINSSGMQVFIFWCMHIKSQQSLLHMGAECLTTLAALTKRFDQFDQV
jgi:hypothetical protein